jgi:hypothetical protein
MLCIKAIISQLLAVARYSVDKQALVWDAIRQVGIGCSLWNVMERRWVMFHLIVFALLIVVIAGMWKVFTKAGQPGWGCIIPFYNIYLLLQIAGRPGWWLILFLIPFVNIIMAFIVSLDVAKSFGKSGGFGVGLFFLSFIFYPILGFGDAQYGVQPEQP